MSTNQLTYLWAKSEPHHPLWCHCLDVGAVAKALGPRFGRVDALPVGWIEWLCATHDVGKADPYFQNKDESLAAQLREHGLQIPHWDAGEIPAKRGFRHERRSSEWLLEDLKRRGWHKHAAPVMARAIVGHHGDWQPIAYPSNESPQAALWQELRDELGQLLWETIAPEPFPLAGEGLNHASVAGARLAAYVVLCDWIASNDELFPYQTLPKNAAPADYYASSCELARQVVATLKLDALPSGSNPLSPTFKNVWPNIPQARPMQELLEKRRGELSSGLAIIEAPMGEGKTEAAIYLAQLWAQGRGTYFALPTQATANAMHARYEKFLDGWKPERAARLMHGGAWLRDESAPSALEFLPDIVGLDEAASLTQARQARDWFRPTRRALLGLEAVGTVDQALLAGLRVKFGPLRLLGLGGKILIVDEVHAYDEYMGVLLEHLLKWCAALEVGVILLSATLSQEQRLRLCRAYGGNSSDFSSLEWSEAPQAPYPLLCFVPSEGKPFAWECEADLTRAQTIGVELHAGLLDDAPQTARLAAQSVEVGGCLCVLCNTVKSAQNTFAALQSLQESGELPSDCQLLLFHARFRAEKRAAIEGQVVAAFGPDAGTEGKAPRPSRAILVATQVVEQSLDVDFDWMISQIAPIDLLLQRAGRLWRHPRAYRREQPELWGQSPRLLVLTPREGEWNFGASASIYGDEMLLRTLAVCHENGSWMLPRDFRPLIETVYRRDAPLGAFAGSSGFQAALEIGQAERDAKRNEARAQAQIHLWIEPDTRAFDVAQKNAGEPEEENGNGATNRFFIAQTRLGDDSAACLVLSTEQHTRLAAFDAVQKDLPRRAQRSPARADLVEIFSQKVGVPLWWLRDAAPLEGFEPIADGQTFLRGHKLLPMRLEQDKMQWQGETASGRFALVDDPQLGLYRVALGEQETEAPTEADAGMTGI